MKLNYKRTILVGFAFFLICTFWNAYDTIIPKILTDKFGMTQANSGIIMALDNVLALFMLPLFGTVSDKCRHRLGRRTPFILYGTIVAAVLLVAGQEGKRSALTHSRVMIHQPLGGVQGQASDIEIEAREIQKVKKELYTIIAQHSHTDFDKVWADSDRNYWMTAEEAKAYGMIDQVLIKK